MVLRLLVLLLGGAAALSLRCTRRSSGRPGAQRCPALSAAVDVKAEAADAYESFTPFERLLFGRFAASVATELADGSAPASSYSELMAMINRMTYSRPLPRVNAQGKNMLVRLFPGWLLPMYRVLIQAPFPAFSAWMNCWVTKFTTNWLMGKSEVYDLEILQPDGTTKIVEQSGLLVEKCRFLESTGCVKTCLHACKVPTQAFFFEEMGLPVTLSPNMMDKSCRFQFGVAPLPLELDEISKSPCLEGCSLGGSSRKKGELVLEEGTSTPSSCVSSKM